MNVLAAIVMGIITLASLYWQVYLLKKDAQNTYEFPRRLVIPLLSGGIVILGVFIYGIIAIFAGHIQDIGGFWYWVGRVFIAVFFAFLLFLKAYFSAAIVGFVVSSFFYFLINFGEVHTIPILGALIGLVFPQSPQWLHSLYAISVSLYALIASVGDSFSWDWGGLDWFD